MGLPRSTFYDAPVLRVGESEIVARITAICDEFEAYGYRRVGAELRHQGVVVNGKKLRRLMREHDLQPKRRRRYAITTDSDHDSPIFPDLAKDMVVNGPNQLGSPISPTSPLRPASSISRPFWMPGHVRWSAMPSADRSTPDSRCPH
jgi:transposase InsO family protein